MVFKFVTKDGSRYDADITDIKSIEPTDRDLGFYDNDEFYVTLIDGSEFVVNIYDLDNETEHYIMEWYDTM